MLGALTPAKGPLKGLTQAATPSSSGRRPRQLRVSAQAFSSGHKQPGRPQPAGRVREQSPSKARAAAAAAPVWEAAEQQAAAPPPLPPTHLHGTNAIVQFDRQQLLQLERQFQSPAVPGADEAAPQQQQDGQQQQQQEGGEAAAAAAEARLQERRQQSAAASTSGRSQQQQQQQRQVGVAVRSTRRHRGGVRGSGATAAPPAAQAAAADAGTLEEWLKGCSERRGQGAPAAAPTVVAAPPAAAASAPAAVAAAGGRAPVAARRRRMLARQALQPQLPTPAEQGLSPETIEDALVLKNARATLRKGRHTRRKPSRQLKPEKQSAIGRFMAALGDTAVLGRQQEARLAAIMQKGRELQLAAAQLAAAKAGGAAPSGASGGRGPAANSRAARLAYAAADAAAAAAAAVSDAELGAALGLPAAEVAQRRANQREAKDLLMQYNTRLVVNLAKRYAGSSQQVADLIPEGMLGLSKSLDRFDAARGFKISTFAHWYIRQHITRAVADQSRVVRLPVHVCEQLYRVNRTMAAVLEEGNLEEPSAEAYARVAAAVGLPASRVVHIMRLARAAGGSGDRPATSFMSGASQKDCQAPEVEALGDSDEPGEEEAVEAERQADYMRLTVDLLLSTLDKRERNVLRLRYGLLPTGGLAAPGGGASRGGAYAAGGRGGEEAADVADMGAMSLGEVAAAYGLSRERIRQIEEKAMRALRKPWRQELVKQLSSAEAVAPSNMTHLDSARRAAGEWLWA